MTRGERADGLYRTVTDEIYDDLVTELVGQSIEGIALWEDSIADGDESPVARKRNLFDLDLYLENRSLVELYGIYLFPDLDSEPLHGLEQIGTMLSRLVEEGVWLDELAVSEDDEMVLLLSYGEEKRLYLNVGGWTLSEWDTLPDA